MKRPIWHLAAAAILGAILGSASMATYLYLFQIKVENNAVQIQKLEERTKRLEKKPAPKISKPTYRPTKRQWWRFWDK
jgi:hypothetical protein